MFDPFRVISIRDCILSYRVDSITLEIFVGAGHALRSTMVCCKMWFRILFLRLTENCFALAEQTISTLADWHISTLVKFAPRTLHGFAAASPID